MSALTPLSQSEFDEIIKKHVRFNSGKPNGARAYVKFKSLVGLDFRGVDLSGADFTGSDLRGCNMARGKYHGTTFYGCNLQNAIMENADFTRADFRGADVTGASLAGSDMTGADMRAGAKIIAQDAVTNKPIPTLDGKTIFKGTDLSNADLSAARAAAVDLSQANLENARMAECDLTQANLQQANMAHVDLSQANLENARMAECILTDANLEGTKMEGAKLDGALTDEPAGIILDYTQGEDGPLVRSLKEHATWIQMEGKKGVKLDISNCDMRSVHDLGRYTLTAIKATNTVFQGMNLMAAQMQMGMYDNSDFRDCNLSESDLRGSSFVGAKMARCNFRKAHLTPLEFGVGRKKVVDLSHADLSFSDLSGCRLSDAILIGANFEGAIMDKADLRGVDLTRVVLSPEQLLAIRIV